jgi:hypothetical protein
MNVIFISEGLHRAGSVTQQKFILSRFWKPEYNIEVTAGLRPLCR